VRTIAFYLPQFHPIPENNEWWGRGFTEWTNVAKAKPLFRGHYQPHVPADLGFYDLRVPETRHAQSELARQYGIEGFCYWHYWFGNGRRILERPFQEVLDSGEPDFPFCLGWANQTWTGIWHGAPNRVLVEQLYPGPSDHERHFYAMLRAFQDPRYIRVDGRPLFVIYAPTELPEPAAFLNLWTSLAQREGLPGFFFVAHGSEMPGIGFDAFVHNLPFTSMQPRGLGQLARVANFALRKTTGKTLRDVGLQRGPTVRRYADFVSVYAQSPLRPKELPLLIPNWDNTPRSGRRGVVLGGATPELFEQMCVATRTKLKTASQPIVFVKAWNEWAEGNHLEPDLKFGLQFLEAMRRGLGL
jgi:hypothetical protein